MYWLRSTRWDRLPLGAEVCNVLHTLTAKLLISAEFPRVDERSSLDAPVCPEHVFRLGRKLVLLDFIKKPTVADLQIVCGLSPVPPAAVQSLFHHLRFGLRPHIAHLRWGMGELGKAVGTGACKCRGMLDVGRIRSGCADAARRRDLLVI